MKKFFSVLQLMGFLLVLGAAAGSDGASLSLGTCVLLCLTGGLLTLTAAVLKNQWEYTRRRQAHHQRRNLITD